MLLNYRKNKYKVNESKLAYWSYWTDWFSFFWIDLVLNIKFVDKKMKKRKRKKRRKAKEKRKASHLRRKKERLQNIKRDQAFQEEEEASAKKHLIDD